MKASTAPDLSVGRGHGGQSALGTASGNVAQRERQTKSEERTSESSDNRVVQHDVSWFLSSFSVVGYCILYGGRVKKVREATTTLGFKGRHLRYTLFSGDLAL